MTETGYSHSCPGDLQLLLPLESTASLKKLALMPYATLLIIEQYRLDINKVIEYCLQKLSCMVKWKAEEKSAV